MNIPVSVPTSIQFKKVSFGFGATLIFDRLSLELGMENPVVILGPSGCGKTTLLRLGAGLLPPWSGDIAYTAGDAPIGCSFVFQEPRLLPWFTVLENVLIPLKARFPRSDGEARARHFLALVSLQDKAGVYPEKLSGGQRQRVSIARAFAYPAQFLFMDEPFQSLDIPLRIELMEMTLGLLKAEPRLCIAVTHDPREALVLGQRIIILGKPPGGICFDETIRLSQEDREYASAAQSQWEQRILKVLQAGDP
ncbi:MAG: ATP-binding cassette domain-containing protein [Treponema sp.]|jgi:NitT/TauT family transport system ATP-binding protein|nr:ATP-binding cassette domain-containing protein [Treponema sp.]